MPVQSEEDQVEESKYIQQHLANERTFLAWVRTAIAMMGIGFVITGYHFQMNEEENVISDLLAFSIGAFSLFVGVLTITSSLLSYMMKREAINIQTFRSSRRNLLMISMFILALSLLYAIYFYFQL